MIHASKFWGFFCKKYIAFFFCWYFLFREDAVHKFCTFKNTQSGFKLEVRV